MRKIMFCFLLLMVAGLAEKAYSQVAKIGDTEYATLAAAYNAVQNGETILMQNDVVVSSTILITGKNFTLDLNGKRLTCDDGNYVSNTLLQIGTGADITITDSSPNQDGVITCANDDGKLYPIVLDKTGRLTINAGNIVSPENTTKGFCAVSVSNANSRLIINGGTLSTTQTCTSIPFGVIYNSGTTIINGGIIKNTSTDGGIYSRGVYNSGTLIVNGGEISAPYDNAIWNLKNKSLSLSSAAKITGDIAGGNTTLDKYIISDGNNQGVLPVTANTITYERGSSNAFGTVCLPFIPDSKASITYYTLKEATDNTLTLEQVDALAVNTPYIYYTEDGTYNVSKTTNTTLNPVAGTTTNADGWSLNGVYKRTLVFASSSDEDYDASDDSHVLAPNSYYIKDNGFSKTNGYVVIKPFRAYITAPDATSSNHYEISVIDEATSVKSLIDGERTIAAIYDTNGVKLSRLQRGVNIVVMDNGKRGKIIVK